MSMDKIAASVADLIDRKLRQGTLEGVDELEAIISAALSQSLAERDKEIELHKERQSNYEHEIGTLKMILMRNGIPFQEAVAKYDAALDELDSRALLKGKAI